ncbi:MAG: hypothetical protein GY930_20860, partial [bacterium]|nr:hypothetical protein [bacterium]
MSGARRCHAKAAKRLSVKIARLGVAKTNSKKQNRKELYAKLIGAFEKVCALSGEIACCLEMELKESPNSMDSEWVEARLKGLRNYTRLAKRVIWQTSERILHGRQVRNSEKLFGHYPQVIAGDKGYWRGAELESWAKDVNVVCIPKKGKRTVAETTREHDPLFRLGQAFRAGIEGSISFLKRVLSLARCMQ